MQSRGTGWTVAHYETRDRLGLFTIGCAMNKRVLGRMGHRRPACCGVAVLLCSCVPVGLGDASLLFGV